MKFLLQKSEKLNKMLKINKSLVNVRKNNLKDLEEMCQLLNESATKFESETKQFESHFIKKNLKWFLIIAVIALFILSLGFSRYWFSS